MGGLLLLFLGWGIRSSCPCLLCIMHGPICLRLHCRHFRGGLLERGKSISTRLIHQVKVAVVIFLFPLPALIQRRT